MERRLAAILAADVVGYSRLMESDEEGAREAVDALNLSAKLEGRKLNVNVVRPTKVR